MLLDPLLELGDALAQLAELLVDAGEGGDRLDHLLHALVEPLLPLVERLLGALEEDLDRAGLIGLDLERRWGRRLLDRRGGLDRPVALGVTTEDGARGIKGRVTIPLEAALKNAGPGGAMVYACGPEPMLEAVRSLRPDAQLAWEAPMACGYGACYGCVVEIDGELKRLCVEGPVVSFSS